MDFFWLAVTDLGRDEAFIIVLGLYTLLVNPRGGHDLAVALSLSYLANTALKYGLNLPRPFTGDPALASAAARATADGPGLPSGHTQMSATLWLGMAAQLRQPTVTGLAVLLVALVSLSRLTLNVHFPSDVVVGLGLGLAFAWAAKESVFSRVSAARWGVPLLALLTAALLPEDAPREYGMGLGLLAGFWSGNPEFEPPRDWAGRLIVGLGGLMLVFALSLGLGATLGTLKQTPLVRTVRYGLLAAASISGVPRVLRRWLPVLRRDGFSPGPLPA